MEVSELLRLLQAWESAVAMLGQAGDVGAGVPEGAQVDACRRAKGEFEDYLLTLTNRVPVFRGTQHMARFKTEIEPRYLRLVVLHQEWRVE